jgi:fermentation-respiration switch protein FrsA (DUF1100 family)
VHVWPYATILLRSIGRRPREPLAQPGFLALVWLLCWSIAVAGCSERLEAQFIFFPEPHLEATPEAMGLAYEEVEFTAEDGVRLHGWFVPASGARWTVLWFHGNAGNISHRLDNLLQMHRRLQVHVFIFDYRQYGRSQGRVSEQGTYLDARAALQTLQQRADIDPQSVVLFGRSLGSAVAVELARHATCRALILESPFTSVPDMAARVLPLVPIGRLLRTRYDSLGKIAQIAVPLLILHGDRDDVVPFEHGQRLFAAAAEPKTFYTIPGAGHNDTYLVGGEAYWQAWEDFLATLETTAP